uniref:Uncharacterized protein n=1 Tax=Anguilla anguilla TaxID=7936 RepID=A0A0E9WBR4_ANGAN
MKCLNEAVGDKIVLNIVFSKKKKKVLCTQFILQKKGMQCPD